MDFDFSDDQRLLQDEVRKMLADTSTSAEIRRVLDGRTAYAETVWRNLIDMGAAAAAIPESYGGAGLGYLELCLVAEEAGRHLAPGPLASRSSTGTNDGPNGNWKLSTVRALTAREVLEEEGVDADQFRRVTGKADTEPLRPKPRCIPYTLPAIKP